MNEGEFKNKIEEWLANVISKKLIVKREPKIIRDPVHGIQRFFGWEVNFLDLPITQRLRNIRQNAFAFLTYHKQILLNQLFLPAIDEKN